MTRLHFEDQGQDLMWFDVNDEGIIVDEQLFANRWINHKVTNLDDLKKHRTELVIVEINRKPSQLIYPVEKVEKLA